MSDIVLRRQSSGYWHVLADGIKIGNVSGDKALGGYQFEAHIPGRTTVFSTRRYLTARAAALTLGDLVSTS